MNCDVSLCHSMLFELVTETKPLLPKYKEMDSWNHTIARNQAIATKINLACNIWILCGN